jgi:serine/threonine protein kinase
VTPFQPSLDPSEVASELAPLGMSILRRIDGGGQGDVFLCEHPDYGRCALKVFVPEARQRVEAETGFLRSVDCSAIVTLFDAGEVRLRGEPSPFTVMEYVDGASLRQKIQAGDFLIEAQARELVTAVSSAISEMWRRGKVHRDIKPDNILVSGDGRSVLIDFGIVRHLDLPTMTARGFAPGTQGYKSPEHDSAIRNPTYKADVFSLGVTTYEALSGVHPFGRSQDAINQGMTPPSIATLTACSDEFADLLTRMLHPRAVMRPELSELLEGGSK